MQHEQVHLGHKFQIGRFFFPGHHVNVYIIDTYKYNIPYSN